MPQGGPLLGVVGKNDQRMLAGDEFEEFASAATQFLLVFVIGPEHAVFGCRQMFSRQGINREQHHSCVRKMEEHALVPGHMTAGLKETDAGKEFCVAVNLSKAHPSIKTFFPSAVRTKYPRIGSPVQIRPSSNK